MHYLPNQISYLNIRNIIIGQYDLRSKTKLLLHKVAKSFENKIFYEDITKTNFSPFFERFYKGVKVFAKSFKVPI